jgi:alginate O-acetyltransferase complex protein AlgI
MALAGLWHGAAWHFVVWGGTQGLLLGAERAAGIQPVGFRGRPFRYTIGVVLTLGVWVAFLAIFRAPGLPEAWITLQQMFTGARGESLLTPWHFGLVACALVLAVLEEWRNWFEGLVSGPIWAYGAALAMLLAALEMFSMTARSVPFFYFQF